jgi:radical SAM superfamily enzyme YgiQ (UPF0313 family)
METPREHAAEGGPAAPLRVVLISTYELGRQPFGLASPAAWLEAAGASVACLDLAVQALDTHLIASADLIALYVPMHTATRIATTVVAQVQQINPHAHICFYGLYASVNEGFLRALGADTILGGEFEQGLVALVARLADESAHRRLDRQPELVVSRARQQFRVPERRGLPDLRRYAQVVLADGSRRVAGYTEASRGCKHMCRHCPIVPVYAGIFRIVQPEVVLDDIRQQIAAGARHITFGDPDFFNGPTHAIRIVRALHAAFPDVTYDVTIKIEHLLKHACYLPVLRDTGCLFVTSAVEAVDDGILAIFDKRHTRADFIHVATLLRQVGLTLNPTFVTFTPWTSLKGYLELLALLDELELVEHVAPIQYAIRLLIPAGSRLLELPMVQQQIGAFDQAALCYRWVHPDPQVDQLYEDVLAVAKQTRDQDRRAIFETVWALAQAAANRAGGARIARIAPKQGYRRTSIPHVTEPWFC